MSRFAIGFEIIVDVREIDQSGLGYRATIALDFYIRLLLNQPR